ncbi:hypothetical protein AWZ03_013978 [Drosophila navojoa]|uniref:Uncharacterized protein n=1 Tax=Drosophila navojoa TaxID=7232 RepID=A0A484ASN1_DRONA|nr:hypothetical protein AWZ03_013978 [Drosophila navojoa]
MLAGAERLGGRAMAPVTRREQTKQNEMKRLGNEPETNRNELKATSEARLAGSTNRKDEDEPSSAQLSRQQQQEQRQWQRQQQQRQQQRQTTVIKALAAPHADAGWNSSNNGK